MEKKVFLWYSWSTDVTGKELARELGISCGKRPPKDYIPDLFICWGANTNIKSKLNPKKIIKVTYPKDAFYFNHPDKIEVNRNKYEAMKILKEDKVSIPKFFHRDTITQAVDTGKICFPIVGRKYVHQGGSGFYLSLCKKDLKHSLNQDAKYFMEYIKNDREFRVHIFDGEVIKVQEKVQEKEDADKWIRSNNRGWKFSIRNNWDTLPKEVLDEAIDSVDSLELDFGAVDIIYSDDKKAYVIEVNSGPSLNDNGIQLYIEHFKKFIGEHMGRKKKRKSILQRLKEARLSR